ncbi:TcpQ domain-containing protein [Polaromonas sp. JS666]|uniref:TcpQ domain-containing protein n=1 Tax=Polaromonas sp. (strain JS666 / ATCC BAA-500) TaxID=296591 RepID=UPI000046464E|nr:TcpQ domain-containing protein [Polaromonas sp. JS666]ABE47307.1 hypothetical protein Bpro_5453 [Polaromonas sp. JS666]
MNTNHILKSTLQIVIACAPFAASAQTIQVSTEPFVDKPALPFAAPNQPRPAAAVPLAPAAPEVPLMEIVKGKRVDEQLRDFGKRAGWNLIWQAPEYVLDQNMTLPGGFEESVTTLLKGANEAGARLQAVFYRGNKTVRISEF